MQDRSDEIEVDSGLDESQVFCRQGIARASLIGRKKNKAGKEGKKSKGGKGGSAVVNCDGLGLETLSGKNICFYTIKITL